MKTYFWAAIIGGAMIAVVPASATTTTFNFATVQAGSTGNAYGDSLTETVGGITVTETAFSLGSGYTSGSKFVAAAVDNYSGATLGLGICSANDPSGAACGSPNHQVDNAVGDEFVLFKFSGGTVSLGAGSSITVANYAPDGGTSTAVDLTYYNAATAITAATTALSAEGTGTTVNANAGSGVAVTDAITGGASSITYLLVAASVLDSTDAFKINSLTVTDGSTTFTSTTPEPASFALLGLGLAGMGLYSWKRKSARV